MQKTKTILLATLWAMLSAALVIIVVFEPSLMAPGGPATNVRAEYVSSVVMELIALGCIPLALRLFKWRKISDDLIAHKEHALLKWGMLRMLMLCVPMISNLTLYYLFMNSTFVYLALIHAVCLMFVYPTIDRCVAETTPQS